MDKKRTYTITYAPTGFDVPSIKITGKWLKEIGFDIGNKLEIIKSKNMLILAKVKTK